ncbi:hypothetical protein GCM10008024_28620 [Allgaiera indica]|uniref:Uncharacterized protein n=1 Tax=Allgaiera indica TaxID=765699 RepID=A0AAN5A072_9RHOB|nr:hypothetical protein GCM10008024_28620 [Allgaiera indica]
MAEFFNRISPYATFGPDAAWSGAADTKGGLLTFAAQGKSGWSAQQAGRVGSRDEGLLCRQRGVLSVAHGGGV